MPYQNIYIYEQLGFSANVMIGVLSLCLVNKYFSISFLVIHKRIGLCPMILTS